MDYQEKEKEKEKGESMKHGYFVHNKHGALGPFMTSVIALRMAQLVKGYWECFLITDDGSNKHVTTIDSGYNKE